MRITLITQRLSLDFVRHRSPSTFALLDDLHVELVLDNTWDGSVQYLQTMRLAAPALIHAPRDFRSPPDEVAKYCADHTHILFRDDFWIDEQSTNRGTAALLASIRRHVTPAGAQLMKKTDEQILLFARVPGELDMRAVRIPQKHWQQFAEDAERRKVSIETALQQLFAGISAPSRATVVAPLRAGTILQGIGIYCGGPCKKIHPLNLPLGPTAQEIALRQGWRNVPEAGLICPQCVAGAKATRAKRETNNP